MKTLLALCCLVAVAITVPPAVLADLVQEVPGGRQFVMDAAEQGVLPGGWDAELAEGSAQADELAQDAPSGQIEVGGQAPGTAEQCTQRGSAQRGDVEAALRVVTTDDHGQSWGVLRFEKDRVGVSVVGDLADTPGARAQVAASLAWMSRTSGMAFELGGADLVIDLSAGNSPQGSGTLSGNGAIATATAQWDPSHPHACRWAFEEISQVSGAMGDHGPAGAVLSTDQSALGPSDFDEWVLGALYQAEGRSEAALRAALEASS